MDEGKIGSKIEPGNGKISPIHNVYIVINSKRSICLCTHTHTSVAPLKYRTVYALSFII